MTSRKQPSAAFWATVVVVVALVAYPLSIGPLVLFDRWGCIPESGWIPEALEYFCVPYQWLMNNGPQPLADALMFYLGLWC